MKMTVDLPASTFRRAKTLAAERGMTLEQWVTEALEVYPAPHAKEPHESQAAPWMAGFGALAHLSEENRRILGLIEEEFGILDLNPRADHGGRAKIGPRRRFASDQNSGHSGGKG